MLAVVAVLGDLGSLGWWTQWLLDLRLLVGRLHAAPPGARSRRGSRRARALARASGRSRGRCARRSTRRARRSASRAAPHGPGSLVARAERRAPAQARAGRSRSRPGARRRTGEAEPRARTAGRARAQPRWRPRRRDGWRACAHSSRACRELAGRPPALETRAGRRCSARASGASPAISRARRTRSWRARRTVADADAAKRRTGQAHTREQREERARLLDAQAALPAAGRANASGERRDYAALAALAGHARGEYDQLDPRRRRQARAQIDRELAMRRELGGAVADLQTRAQPDSPGRLDRHAGARGTRGRALVSGCARRGTVVPRRPRAAHGSRHGNAKAPRAAVLEPALAGAARRCSTTCSRWPRDVNASWAKIGRERRVAQRRVSLPRRSFGAQLRGGNLWGGGTVVAVGASLGLAAIFMLIAVVAGIGGASLGVAAGSDEVGGSDDGAFGACAA